MSLPEKLNEVQRLNLIVMENIATVGFEQVSERKKSNTIYINLIKESILYQNEKVDFLQIENQNKAIIIQLVEGEITPQEASIQSNSLWIDFINTLRAPNLPKLNFATIQNQNFYNF